MSTEWFGLPDDVQATDAVPRDRFDEAAWAFARDELDSLDAQVREFAKEQDYCEDFFADLFNLAMKGDPRVRSRDEMTPTHVPNREMVEHFHRYPEFQALHQYTAGSLYSSAMALLSMQSEIEAAYARMAAARELAKLLAEAIKTAKDLQDAGDEEGFLEALAALTGLTEQADAAAEAAAGAGALGLRVGARRAAEEAEEEAALMAAFGVEDGVLQQMSFTERLALAKRLKNSRMAAFVACIGAFRTMARAELRRKVMNVPSEIVGVTASDDLTRLVPQEYIALATPELEDDFWLRYTEHRLMTWQLSGTERQGKGPIIVVCDESGSMETPDLGGVTREAWSKGFTLALLDTARRDNRQCHYIGFSSAKQQWHIDLSPDVAGIEGVIEFAEHFWGGGTHYEKPLQMALDLATKAQEWTQGRPDIVFITDDAYTKVAPAFLTTWQQGRDDLSLRCYGIHIGGSRSGALEAVADNVHPISSYVHSVDTVADIFRSL